jgi:hypothetical protein
MKFLYKIHSMHLASLKYCLLFPTAFVMENSQKCYEIYSVRLQTCTVMMAILSGIYILLVALLGAA